MRADTGMAGGLLFFTPVAEVPTALVLSIPVVDFLKEVTLFYFACVVAPLSFFWLIPFAWELLLDKVLPLAGYF